MRGDREAALVRKRNVLAAERLRNEHRDAVRHRGEHCCPGYLAKLGRVIQVVAQQPVVAVNCHGPVEDLLDVPGQRSGQLVLLSEAGPLSYSREHAGHASCRPAVASAPQAGLLALRSDDMFPETFIWRGRVRSEHLAVEPALSDDLGDEACVVLLLGPVCEEWRCHVHEVGPELANVLALTDCAVPETRNHVQ